MRSITLENNDQMPVLGLGTWKSRKGEVYQAVKTAIEMGYRHIDCAPIYGNEIEIGQALKECFDEKIVGREELWITSKLWNDHHQEKDVLPGLKKTLQDLQLEYLDLFLIHWPVAIDPETYKPGTAVGFIPLENLPVTETWRGMEAAKEAGLSKHIGVCNFSVRKLNQLVQEASQPPEMNQIELHPYLAQKEMLTFCSENGIHLTAYSPLGSPDRSPKIKAEKEPVLMDDPVLVEIAYEKNCSVAQVLIAWAIERGTAVIPKSVNPNRMRQNLAALDIELSQTEINRIHTLDQHYRYITGTFWTPEGSPYTLKNLWDEY